MGKVIEVLDKVRLVWSKSNRWHRVFFIFFLVELKLLPGGQVGFECNDPALSYPFMGDTVTWKWLFAITLLLPLAVMLLVEKTCHKHENTSKSRSQALRWYKEYLFGFLVNISLVETLKQLVGSPRPHFFDTCQPEEAVSCQGSEYVSSYTCTKAYWNHQSNKSFPSGHSSLSIHAGIFIAYYLHQRTSHTRARLSVQSVCVLAALFCCASRMMDHRHHWWDVLAGALIAAPVLLYTILFLCKNFDCPAVIEEIKEKDQTNHSNNFKEASNKDSKIST